MSNDKNKNNFKTWCKICSEVLGTYFPIFKKSVILCCTMKQSTQNNMLS